MAYPVQDSANLKTTAKFPSRTFGTTRRPVAPVGQGTWRIEEAAADAAAALRRGLDLGLTHIDTAEMYGSGAAESLVAKAIAGRRDEVFLVSKVLPTNASKRRTLDACEKSLARLQTDRLDSYLLHWRGSHPLEETIAAFDQLLRDGKILSWGVSNFDAADLEETLAAIAGAGHPALPQPGFYTTLEERDASNIPCCRSGAILKWHGGKLPTRRSASRRRLSMRAPGRAGCCTTSPKLTARPPGKWRCGSCCATGRYS